MKQVNLTRTRVFMGRLTGGVEVVGALAAAAAAHQVQSGTLELLGGLHEVELTTYDFVTQQRLKPLVWQRPLEIIAGHGTISLLTGQPHVHLHLTLAFRDDAAAAGITVIGGHCGRALAFAVEFTLTAYDGNPMQRTWHEETGLMLWENTP
ncbi:MAG: DNA-binding protein [Anaerolineae bacterium]|nr:DNA-binding protein [Anaerolineae bacterium]